MNLSFQFNKKCIKCCYINDSGEPMQLKFQISPEDAGRKIYDILRDRYQMSNLLCKRIRLYGELYLNGFPARMIATPSEDHTYKERYRYTYIL